MSGLNETPSSNRLHIGVFGKTNSGKSSFINAVTGQEVSIVSDVAGTTTDPVNKAMEINPLGPCLFIDTAGFNDESKLGKQRVDKTEAVLEKTDIAVIVFSFENAKNNFVDNIETELQWYKRIKENDIPVLLVLNKIDLYVDADNYVDILKENFNEKLTEIITFSCKDFSQTGDDNKITNESVEKVKDALIRLLPENYGERDITGDLVNEEDVVLLVMPQDIQAPKGRLILPQVQTIRELLDKKCLVMSVTTDKLELAIDKLVEPPKLIITDSQVFDYVYEHKPEKSMLTSFSVLFAAYKGDLPYYIEGARAIDRLTPESKVLIAECCTHAPLSEDIGRVKIPMMLKKRIGDTLIIDHVSGTDFPEDLSEYDLIIQCGACMFNRRYVLSRIDRAKRQDIPMTNYGVTIAHVKGILDKISY